VLVNVSAGAQQALFSPPRVQRGWYVEDAMNGRQNSHGFITCRYAVRVIGAISVNAMTVRLSADNATA